MGPRYRVVSAKMRRREFTTWLTAKREGENVTLDGEQMLNDFELEVCLFFLYKSKSNGDSGQF